MPSIWKLGHAADFAVSSGAFASNQSSRIDVYMKYQKRGTSYTPYAGFRQIKEKFAKDGPKPLPPEDKSP
jgi:hypothetical protein